MKRNCWKMHKDLSTHKASHAEDVSCYIMDHPSLLKSELMHYSPGIICCAYVTDPYCLDPADLPIGTEEQEQLNVIQVDQLAKRLVENSHPAYFWLRLASSYPALANHGNPQLLFSFHLVVCARFLSYDRHRVQEQEPT